MRILHRHIQRTLIALIVLVFLITAGLVGFITFINQLNEIGTHHYGVGQAFYYVLLSLPQGIAFPYPQQQPLSVV